MSYPNELLALQNDVRSYYQKIESKLSEDVFYSIFQSPFHSPADILFLGINPGTGGLERDVNPKEQFDYLNADYKYTLKRETNSVFDLAGLSHMLHGRVVKSNIFYWTTQDVRSLNNYRTKLHEYSMREEYYQKTMEWTRTLSEITQPSLVICEGKMAFDEFLVAMKPKYKLLSALRENETFSGSFEGVSFPVIGYSRFSSRIRNKPGFASLLKSVLSQ